MVKKLFFLLSFSVIAIASSVMCIYNYNPYELSSLEFFYFYTSMLMSLTGIISLVIIIIKAYVAKIKITDKIFWISVRQSLFLSLSITLLIALKGLKLFDFWIAIPVIFVFVLLEMYFRTKKINI